MTGIKGRVGKIFSHLLNLPFSVRETVSGSNYLHGASYGKLKRILTRAKEEEEEKLLVRRDRNFDPWITNRPRLKRYKDTLLSNEKEIIVNVENT